MDVNSFVIGYNKGKASAPAGVELNIHYSETEPPKDTSKLWVKTSEPKSVTIKPNAEGFQYVDDLEYSSNINIFTAKACSATYDDHMYVMGGTSGATVQPSDKVNDTYYYTYAAGGYWTNTNGKVKLPVYLTSACCSAYGENIYVFGGRRDRYASTRLNYIYVVDVVANGSYSYSKNLPNTLYDACCARVGDKTYIFGGITGQTASTITDKIISFDPVEISVGYIEEKLPVGIRNMCCAASGTKIYLFGGDTANADILDTIYCFDTETEKLLLLETRVPVGISGAACVALGDYIYVYGGCTDFNAPSHSYDIYRFNVHSHKIEKTGTTLDVGMYAPCMQAVSGKIVIIGGAEYYPSDYGVNNCFRYAHIYTPREDAGLDYEKLLIVADQQNNVFTAFKTNGVKIETGVSIVLKGNAEKVGEVTEAATYKDGEWKTI